MLNNDPSARTYSNRNLRVGSYQCAQGPRATERATAAQAQSRAPEMTGSRCVRLNKMEDKLKWHSEINGYTLEE